MDEYEKLVIDMMAMGFDRVSVVTALDATMQIPDAAVEYLTTGVLPSFLSHLSSNSAS